MALDGFFIKKITNEINEELIGGRINKINNISNNDFIFTVRKNKTKKLLISAHPQNFRIHITEKKYENPDKPSNFCTILRKYLTNGFIENFEQYNNDRLIFLNIKNSDELGYEKKYTLIIELMGKHSNLILTDSYKIILDALKNDYDVDYSRYTIANIEYKLPPTKEKIDPFEANLLEIPEKIEDKNFFTNNFYGFSKKLNDYCYSLTKLQFIEFIQNFNKLGSPIYIQDAKPYFYFINIEQRENYINFSSYSELLDFCYSDKHTSETNKDKHKYLYSFLKTKINRLANKTDILEKELKKVQKDNINELKGNLILANNYMFKKNLPEKITLQNFYSEKLEDIVIKIDPNITIEKNAQNYFNKSKKNKRTIENLNEQLLIAKNDISYFENIYFQLETGDISDIEEIIEELASYKYIKKKTTKKKKISKIKTINIDGTDIYIGKSNIQNDTITNKLAKRDFIWLHVKDLPGSHIVICDNTPSENILKLSAMLAVYYSKSKNENNVLVDYTKIKYVKKISGAKPGMVTYTNQKTLKVNIDLEQIKKYV